MGGFDSTTLFVNLVVGSVGVAMFSYGKKADRLPHLVAGVLLMVYPYFVEGPLTLVSVGVLIIGGLAGAIWLGW